MARVLGIVKIHLNGKLQRTVSGAKLRTGGHKHTSVVGHKRYGSYVEFEPSQVTFTIAKTGDVNLKEIQDLEATTLVFEGDDGVAYLVNNADCTSSVEISDAGGGVAFTFEGDEAEPL
jgi:hypothetical protein